MVNRPDTVIDAIDRLGALAFGSRLRRLSDRLMRDAARVYHLQHFDFEPRWFPVLHFLTDHSPQSVTALARALSITHPAVNQISRAMSKAGLLTSRRAPTDERKTMLALSRKGRKLARDLAPVWSAIRTETKRWLDDSGQDVLALIADLEQSLDDTEMYNRVTKRLSEQDSRPVEVCGYAPHLKRHFRELNIEWLTEYFTVEPFDEALLSDPNGLIIKKGGNVLFARVGGRIVGTVAMIPHGRDGFELAKMAVTPQFQGRRIGHTLAVEAIEWARQKGAHAVILDTSPKLSAAVNLYRQLGFVDVPTPPEVAAGFERCTVRMKLKLDRNNSSRTRRSS